MILKATLAILFLPFVLIYLAARVLVDSFLSGLKGRLLCKNCGTPVPYQDAIFGCCSERCALLEYSDYDEQDIANLETLLQEQPAQERIEWRVLSEREEPESLEIWIDENSQLYLSDFTIKDDPKLKIVGNDGYAYYPN